MVAHFFVYWYLTLASRSELACCTTMYRFLILLCTGCSNYKYSTRDVMEVRSGKMGFVVALA